MSRPPMGRRAWLALAVLVLVAIGVRLAFALRLPPTIVWFDGQHYSRLALGLIQHGAYLDVKGHPSAFWPPGYPLLLAAVYAVAGPSVAAVRIVQAVLGGVGVALVFALARRMLDPRGTWLAALAAAFYPFHVYAVGTFFPVTLLVVQIAAVLLLVRLALERRSAAAALGAGTIGGWAALTAGSSLPAMLVCAAWMAWCGAEAPGAAVARDAAPRRSRATGVRLAALFLVPVLLIVGTWTARNAGAFGRPVLVSTNGGYNFWLGNYPGVGAATGNAFVSDSMEAEANSVWFTVGNEATRDAGFWRLGRRHVVEDVPRFVRLTAQKALLFWSVVAEPVTRDRPRFGFEALASWLSYGLLLPFALFALARSLRRDPFAVLALLLALVYTAVHAVVLSKVRFRLPIDVLVMIYGAGGLLSAWDALRRRGSRAG